MYCTCLCVPSVSCYIQNVLVATSELTVGVRVVLKVATEWLKMMKDTVVVTKGLLQVKGRTLPAVPL